MPRGPTLKPRKRCGWSGKDPLYLSYHDREWGVPLHDDRKLFEMLVLEGAQAGLSWLTILRKREAFREAFDGFDPVRVAAYDRRKVRSLLRNEGIVRNRLKIEAAISNARAFLEVQDELGSFDAYVWRFVKGKPIRNAWRSLAKIPAVTPEAEALSSDLRKRGFRFVGPTICYALMQATGMVNDHVVDCFRWREIGTGVRPTRAARSRPARPHARESSRPTPRRVRKGSKPARRARKASRPSRRRAREPDS